MYVTLSVDILSYTNVIITVNNECTFIVKCQNDIWSRINFTKYSRRRKPAGHGQNYVWFCDLNFWPIGFIYRQLVTLVTMIIPAKLRKFYVVTSCLRPWPPGKLLTIFSFFFLTLTSWSPQSIRPLILVVYIMEYFVVYKVGCFWL